MDAPAPVTIRWRDPKQELPTEDGQKCHLLGGVYTPIILCNIPWVADSSSWVDLFASPDAGAMYAAKSVLGWCPAEELVFDKPEWSPDE